MTYYNKDNEKKFEIEIIESDNNIDITMDMMENANFEYDEDKDIFIGTNKELLDIEEYLNDLKEDGRFYVYYNKTEG